MLYGISDISRNLFGMSSNPSRLRKEEFWALHDVSFDVHKGEAFGIIGPNGSGKTTMLKLLNGIFYPDKGRIEVKGRTGALIEVGAGFHPMLTGRENVYVNAAIFGMKKKEVDSRFDSIVDFADIGNFIDSPVKNYSSGMFVRLGFSVAVHADPELLLVDEVLAVGDLKFQQKCLAKIAGLVRGGAAVVLVSHDMMTVQRVCSKGLLLDRGETVTIGGIKNPVSGYYKLLGSRDRRLPGQDGIKYKDLKIMNSSGKETRTFESGEDIIASFGFETEKKIKNPVVHFSLENDPASYNGYSTHYDGFKVPYVDGKTVINIRIKKAFLSEGEYTVSLGLWDEEFRGALCWDYESTGKVQIKSEKKMLGRFGYDHEWKLKQGK